MTAKSNPPSISSTAFDCPHCGAFTTQSWFGLFLNALSEESRTPVFPSDDFVANVNSAKDLPAESKASLTEWAKNMQSGLVFIECNKDGRYLHNDVQNLFLSKCYNCKKFAVWLHDSLINPQSKIGPLPNPDLPPSIARDFEEARSILSASPRGAAALLRLSVQKLCAELGEKGKNIDADISCLVSKGLNPLVQKSLDVVRVIGNEAVHPGVLDLKDDTNTAVRLLFLVNAITEQMISHPKSIQEIYEMLPEEKRKAIEIRNAKALGGKSGGGEES
jgi:hypothetical protein